MVNRFLISKFCYLPFLDKILSKSDFFLQTYINASKTNIKKAFLFIESVKLKKKKKREQTISATQGKCKTQLTLNFTRVVKKIKIIKNKNEMKFF